MTDTKEQILDVAERLFADRGFHATPLRDITSEAGVNLASVNYHFGSKEALLAAVLERRLSPVNARRLELLDAIEAAAGTGAPNAEEVIRAFLSPPFQKRHEWGAGGDNFLRLLGTYSLGNERAVSRHLLPTVQRDPPSLRAGVATRPAPSRRIRRRLAHVVSDRVDGAHDGLG